MDSAFPSDYAKSGDYEERQAVKVALHSMETRLRGMIAELLQPTISRTSSLQADMDTFKGIVSQHSRGLQEVQLGQFKAMEQVSTIASFKEELGRRDIQRRAREASMNEALQGVHQKLEEYRYSLDQKESSLNHLQRNIDRAALEMNRIQESEEILKSQFEERLDQQSKKINVARSETEVRVTEMELKHAALSEELRSEENGLARVAGELRRTITMVEALQSVSETLKSDKAERSELARLRAEVRKSMNEANASLSAMKHAVGNVVNDVKQHFRTASQTIAAHNTTFISEVRAEYKEELSKSAELRSEVQVFMEKMAEDVRGLDSRVNDAAAKSDTLAGEAWGEIEELNRRRKRDKTSADNELKALKKRLGRVFDNSDAVMGGIDHLYKVMLLMLESDFMQCSLELQDAVDRKRIALMGAKEDETVFTRSHQMEPQRPRPEHRSKSLPIVPSNFKRRNAPNTAPVTRNPQEPVVRVDNRCLSCSGQAPLVLSAFKMACLQYMPSPVEHNGKHHDRNELLDIRYEVLSEAKDALQKGPGSSHTGTDGFSMSTGIMNSARGADALAEYVDLSHRHLGISDKQSTKTLT